MLDASRPERRPGKDHIIIVNTDDAYWLLQGEDHLSGLLTNDEPYPVPVFCVCFDSSDALDKFLGEDGPRPQTLWGINPAIIARLDRSGELQRLQPS